MEENKTKKGKGMFSALGIAIIMGLIIGFAGTNYDTNTEQDKRIQRLENESFKNLINDSRSDNKYEWQTMLHDYYYDSTIVALNSADDDLVRVLSEELFALEQSIENLKEKHNSLVTLLGKLSSKTNANAELINAVKNHVEENTQAIDELTKAHNTLLNALRDHVKKRGLFKKPHDENVKRKLETN